MKNNPYVNTIGYDVDHSQIICSEEEDTRGGFAGWLRNPLQIFGRIRNLK